MADVEGTCCQTQCKWHESAGRGRCQAESWSFKEETLTLTEWFITIPYLHTNSFPYILRANQKIEDLCTTASPGNIANVIEIWFPPYITSKHTKLSSTQEWTNDHIYFWHQRKRFVCIYYQASKAAVVFSQLLCTRKTLFRPFLHNFPQRLWLIRDQERRSCGCNGQFYRKENSNQRGCRRPWRKSGDE